MGEYLKIWIELELDRRGLTSLEYGLIGAALCGVIMVGFQALATGLSNRFGSVGGSL